MCECDEAESFLWLTQLSKKFRQKTSKYHHVDFLLGTPTVSEVYNVYVSVHILLAKLPNGHVVLELGGFQSFRLCADAAALLSRWWAEYNKKKEKKGSIDRRGTCINISDEMIDDRISKSLWHRRKIAFACECLAVRGAWRPAPGELIAAVGVSENWAESKWLRSCRSIMPLY